MKKKEKKKGEQQLISFSHVEEQCWSAFFFILVQLSGDRDTAQCGQINKTYHLKEVGFIALNPSCRTGRPFFITPLLIHIASYITFTATVKIYQHNWQISIHLSWCFCFKLNKSKCRYTHQIIPKNKQNTFIIDTCSSGPQMQHFMSNTFF